MPATKEVGCPGNHANEAVPSADPMSNSFAVLSSDVDEKSCVEVEEEEGAYDGRDLSEEALVTSHTMIDEPALHFSRPCASYMLKVKV